MSYVIIFSYVGVPLLLQGFLCANYCIYLYILVTDYVLETHCKYMCMLYVICISVCAYVYSSEEH